MNRNAWRPGDDERPVKLFDRMPEPEELSDFRPGSRAVALLLREHGINPWNVSDRQDALDVDGWLRPTGRITPDGNDIELERVPWDLPAETVTEILDAFWRIDWAAPRAPAKPAPAEPDPLDVLRQLAACGVSLRPPYAEAARREAETTAAAARRAGRRFWIWMSVYGVSAFLLGWQLRGFFP